MPGGENDRKSNQEWTGDVDRDEMQIDLLKQDRLWVFEEGNIMIVVGGRYETTDARGMYSTS